MEYVFKNIETATAIQSEHLKEIRKKFVGNDELQGFINIKDLGFENIQGKTKIKYILVHSIEAALGNPVRQQEYVILELVD